MCWDRVIDAEQQVPQPQAKHDDKRQTPEAARVPELEEQLALAVELVA